MIPHAVLLSLLLTSTAAVPARSPTREERSLPGKDLDIYSYHIRSDVGSRYAMTVITSRVANRANHSREVSFHVELPKNAFISRFSMNIEGHVYDGVVKKKEEAQEQYTRAVSRGQSAGLVSAVGRSLEEFKTSVTVAALSKVTFELTYEELLKRKLGKYELLIKARPTQVVKDFKIDVHIYETQGISFLDTKGGLVSKGLDGALNTTLTEKEAWVQFSPSQEQQQCLGCGKSGLDGDLLITYDVNRPQSKGDLQVSRGYFVHYFAPRGLPRIPKNVVFIIDRSGSMHGRKIEQTREALLKILGDIPEEDHFGLITFDDQVMPWKNDLVPATPDYLAAAKAFVREIRDRGSTDINAALLEGVRMLNKVKETQPQRRTSSILILLTDGDPTSGVTDLRKIQANVKEAIGRRYTLYCLGFGFDVNYDFLEKMALENEGVARRIYSDSDAALQLQGFYEEVATPLLLDVQLNYTGASNLTLTSFGQYYKGSEIVVAGQVIDNNLETLTAEITANSKSEEMTFHSNVNSEIMNFYIYEMYIQRLWAYLTVQQLLERVVLLQGQEQKTVREQALALALKYSFVTPLTSMVVTKPEGENAQVAHKPKEGEHPTARGGHASPGMQGLPGPPMMHPGLGMQPAPPMMHPGMAMRPAFPNLFTSHPGGMQPDQFEMDMDSDLVVDSVDTLYDDYVHATHISFTTAHHTTVAPTALTDSQSLRLLLPAQGQMAPLCYELDVPGEPIFSLLEDRNTGLSVTGQIGGAARKRFRKIGLHFGQEWHIVVNTTFISFTHKQKTDLYAWAQFPINVKSNSVSLLGQGSELQVTVGRTRILILLHQQGGDHFLWPDVRQQPPGSHATGLMGRLLVEYEVKQMAPSVELQIQGQVVSATKVSTVDYRTLSVPTVHCWLISYHSFLQGELSSLIVSQL
ncbi:inter-alpha-trypsin inhibitor heavy chain H3-like isoform X2 [Megalops cyprinoides]|uniref:inter-alpha-trypsin inhibitor heavy chain H3-like isoform X2 n=1 Tax=Megalops cyprinoides TaxID=118141 RepID=UPI001864024D|nr:inter-alpha-trypsin inhibitor heavy chain H3-like isoform X2 [Megalops cyprinoides]